MADGQQETAEENAGAGDEQRQGHSSMKSLQVADDGGSTVPAMAAVVAAVRQRVTVAALALLKDYAAARGLNTLFVLVSYLQVC
jgi:hypothetical protein